MTFIRNNIAPISRILARYVAGGLASAGLLMDGLEYDPDTLMIIAAGITAVVEGFYAMAKARGWQK